MAVVGVDDWTRGLTDSISWFGQIVDGRLSAHYMNTKTTLTLFCIQIVS